MKELPPAFRSIPSGGELVEALGEAFGRHRGWIQAVGFVDDVELELAGDGADERRTFRGHFVLASLAGPLGGPYGVTLSRASGERVELLAGILVRARSGGVSALCISSGEAPSRVLAETGGDAPAPAASPGFAKRPLVSAFAAKVGVSQAARDDEDEPALPEPGDLAEHFAFGLCDVLTVAGDRLTLRDRKSPGRIREIDSARLAITGPVEHDGRRLFRLAKR